MLAYPRHCQRSEAIHRAASGDVDCFVASLLAMTWIGPNTKSEISRRQMLLPRCDQVTDFLRYRDRAVGLLIGVDPDDLASHERIAPALQENRKFEGHARIADPRHARTD